MLLDVLHLLGPAIFIHTECFKATLRRNFVESGFGKYQQRSIFGLLQAELDEGRCLLGVIPFEINGIRVPGEGKKPFIAPFSPRTLPIYSARNQGRSSAPVRSDLR
jgi:hypothetical protein